MVSYSQVAAGVGLCSAAYGAWILKIDKSEPAQKLGKFTLFGGAALIALTCASSVFFVPNQAENPCIPALEHLIDRITTLPKDSPVGDLVRMVAPKAKCENYLPWKEDLNQISLKHMNSPLNWGFTPDGRFFSAFRLHCWEGPSNNAPSVSEVFVIAQDALNNFSSFSFLDRICSRRVSFSNASLEPLDFVKTILKSKKYIRNTVVGLF